MFLRTTIVLLFASSLVVACERPNSIELGAVCKGSAECKDPADTCLTIGTQSKCSMACSKDNRCPEGYACPVTDASTKKVGMCLPRADVGKSTVMAYSDR